VWKSCGKAVENYERRESKYRMVEEASSLERYLGLIKENSSVVSRLLR